MKVGLHLHIYYMFVLDPPLERMDRPFVNFDLISHNQRNKLFYKIVKLNGVVVVLTLTPMQ